MTRSRKTAREAGTTCAHCGSILPTPGSQVSPRKYCSSECINGARRERYVGNARPPRTRGDVVARMYQRVIRTDSECWEWQGYRMPSGYGQIGLEDRRVATTHRVSWEWANGTTVPSGLFVRHKCDNPPCINPNHLEIGTAAQNSQDAVDRGRQARGFSLPVTRLSDADVSEIRSSYKVEVIPGRSGRHSNAPALARRFGVSVKYVRDVANGKERKK